MIKTLKRVLHNITSPGPAYNLPTLVGYMGHDPSRRRSPAYSLAKRTGVQYSLDGPGPCYNFPKVTHHGLENSPAYSIAGRTVMKPVDLGPGPGAYKPEQCPPVNHSKRSPIYSIKSRSGSWVDNEGPGPSAYYLPSCIGSKVPDKKAAAAFTISGFHGNIGPDALGPGPAAYTRIDHNVMKRKSPAYTLSSRHVLTSYDFNPGPAYYPLYNSKKNAPKFSFGVKHKECAMTAIIDIDEEVITAPGSKYMLKPLTGYIDHCISKLRNPAYTFGRRQTGLQECRTPGPQYMFDTKKPTGFTFGVKTKMLDSHCSPGPKYHVLPPRPGPSFSLRFRTPFRKSTRTPGPYHVVLPQSSPAFSIGWRQTGTLCVNTAGLYDYDANAIKPCAPKYSMGRRQTGDLTCHSPGPKYYPKPAKKWPMYSFGTKHSKCAPPYIVNCDEAC